MLQFGGHHLAINLTIGGSQASMTPSLPAAQPATFEVEGRTVRPLGDENDKAFALVNALDATQRSQAVLNYRVADLVLGPGQDGRTIQPEGLRASSMTAPQQAMLLALIEEWAGIMTDAYAGPRMADIKAQPATDALRVERPNHQRRRGVLPRAGSDDRHRVRAAGRRRSHSHDLSRPHERLRSEACAPVEPAPSWWRPRSWRPWPACRRTVTTSICRRHGSPSIQPASRLELSLTPGIAVADAVIRDIDVNGDAVLSPAEQRTYAERVLRGLSLHVDDRPVPLTLASSSFPAATTLRGGDAFITLRIDAGTAPAPGAHRLSFRNANAAHGAVYLANPLMPDDDRVAITGMTHAVDQSGLTVAYTVRPSRDWSWLWLSLGLPA